MSPGYHRVIGELDAPSLPSVGVHELCRRLPGGVGIGSRAGGPVSATRHGPGCVRHGPHNRGDCRVLAGGGSGSAGMAVQEDIQAPYAALVGRVCGDIAGGRAQPVLLALGAGGVVPLAGLCHPALALIPTIQRKHGGFGGHPHVSQRHGGCLDTDDVNEERSVKYAIPLLAALAVCAVTAVVGALLVQGGLLRALVTGVGALVAVFVYRVTSPRSGR